MLVEGTGVVAERYAVDGLIGRGGMADVYRALDQVLEREVAVKVLRGDDAEQPDRDRFRKEAQLVAALDHPGLVAVLDAGVDDDVPYLVMDLVDGGNLAAFCRDEAVAPHSVARLGAELAGVLSYVHAKGIVHGDVKPSNILIGRDGVVRLADFGIARMMADPACHAISGTTTTGTAAYISPEQVRGETGTSASDVYSLGLVLLEALTGLRAYPGGPAEAALARLHASPAIPTSLPSGWPALLSRMTDSDPARRPSTSEVETALRALEVRPAASG